MITTEAKDRTNEVFQQFCLLLDTKRVESLERSSEMTADDVPIKPVPSIEIYRTKTYAFERLKEDKYTYSVSSYDIANEPFNSDSISLLHYQSFKFTEGFKPVVVKRQLRSQIEFWKKFGASQFVLDTIYRGYI